MRDYSNYHGNLSFTDKLLRDGIKTFERSLTASPDSYMLVVDGEEKQVMIQSTSNYDERRILFKENDLSWGDIVEFQDEKWLVTERPINNRLHDKSKMQLCNNNMAFEKWEREIIDWDRMNNPIYGESTLHVTEIPCVIESISNLNTKTTTGQPINIPEGDMVLNIQYTEDELIKLGSVFKVFGDTYYISGIDKSKTDGSKGILVLVVSRTTNNT